MQIQLSEHFTYKKLIRFVLPSIIMMIFTSIYNVVDGLFVSNFVGKTALAAINITLPFLMAIAAIGFMIGTGGSALVGKTLGEGKRKEANQYFSLLVYTALTLGIVFSILGFLFLPALGHVLGADGELLEDVSGIAVLRRRAHDEVALDARMHGEEVAKFLHLELIMLATAGCVNKEKIFFAEFMNGRLELLRRIDDLKRQPEDVRIRLELLDS